jgi:excinuclease UvrABC nuclease subunit
MPIMTGWRSLKSESAPEAPGVYELGDFNGSVVYLGSSGNLKRSIARKASGQEPCIEGRAVWFRYEQTPAFVARFRELLWEYREAEGGLPLHNHEDEPA